MSKDEEAIDIVDGSLDDHQDHHGHTHHDSEVKNYHQIIEATRTKYEKDLRKELDGYLTDHLKERKSNKHVWLASAASILLLLGVWFIMRGENEPTPMKFNKTTVPISADSSSYDKNSIPNLKPDSIAKESELKKQK